MDIKVIENLESIEILGFENEFIQVIMNLLNNAKDVLEDKGVENKLIFIDIYKQNDKAVFSIKDNGQGINKDIINRVLSLILPQKRRVTVQVSDFICQRDGRKTYGG